MYARNDLRVEVRPSRGNVEVVLSGVINEAARMDPGGVPRGSQVVIDCGGIIAINSFGVRTWVNFLTNVCETARRVSLARMPPVLVSQASMVLNFLGDAEVESFFSPWCCLDCNHEDLQLHGTSDVVPSSLPCPECGGDMEFDGIRDSYLAFRDSLVA